VKPHELTGEDFTAVQSLIAEGGEVDRTRLETLLKSCHWIALIEREGQLVCTAAIKPARKTYMARISRKSGYTLDAGTFVGEFGYVVTDPPYRRQGLAAKISKNVLEATKGNLYATTRDDNPGIQEILRRNGLTKVGLQWPSVQHPGSSVVLWIRLA
jgi:predicted GNAT family N-acyltransferase